MIYQTGKKRRLSRLFHEGKTLIVPVDDSLIFGPKDGLLAIRNTIKEIVKGEPNALLGFQRDLELVSNENANLPFIFNLTASTIMGQHVSKTMISTVEFALKNGADCVACHVNYSSQHENIMIHNLSAISEECDRLGMPLLVIAYPRCIKNDKEYNYDDVKENDPNAYAEIVAHAVRVSDELGADIIKTHYTGTMESFQKVVFAANGKPLVIAGGAKKPVAESLRIAEEAMKAGACGISYGRNVFNADDVEYYISALKRIVFQG
jgi:DhnA family fructose-bisphosphate aldolase class Ia